MQKCYIGISVIMILIIQSKCFINLVSHLHLGPNGVKLSYDKKNQLLVNIEAVLFLIINLAAGN